MKLSKLPIVLLVFLGACATAPSWVKTSDTLSSMEQIDFPEIGVESRMTLGETLAVKGYKSFTPGIKLLEEVTLEETSMFRPRHYIKSGTISQGASPWLNKKSGETATCFDMLWFWDAHPNWFNKSGSRLDVLCRNSRGEIPNPYMLFQDGASPAGINAKPFSAKVEDLEQVDLLKPTYVQEFIYNGRVGDALKFVYREFSGDYVKPAFSQEVQYDLSTSSEIGFKNLKLRVIDATNTEITYELISNF